MRAESDPSDIKERMLVFRNENVGNFHNGCKGERYGLAHIAWAVIVAPASMVFPTTFITGQHSGSRFLYNLKLTPLSEPTEQIINNTMSKKVNKAIKDVDPKEAKTLIELAIKVLKDLFK